MRKPVEKHDQSAIERPTAPELRYRLDRVSHVKNFQVIAFYELKPLPQLLIAGLRFGSFSQQADHFRGTYI
jgi:hypothetical protein